MKPDGPTRREYVWCVAMFVATLLSVFSAHAVFWMGRNPFTDPAALHDSLAFAVPLMAILLAHEMGHYVVARLHGFSLSLPLFIPFPTIFGTLGAIIRLRTPPRSREALLEMGVAGPLSGAAVAFAVLAVALRWTLPRPSLVPDQTYLVLGDPLVVKVLGTLVLGTPPDRLATFHPAALAGWVGCFLTGINLLPIGQLDGGHILNAASPRAARVVSRLGPFALLAAGYFWAGWVVWGVLLFVLSAGRPLPVGRTPALPLRARLLAVAAVAVFALTFLPVPMVEQTVTAAP
jgi:membrane-associated protease RseP (regulator of RpoE activity)